MAAPLIVANWKMNGTLSECQALARALTRKSKRYKGAGRIVIAPPFTALATVNQTLGRSPIQLAAQNCHWENSGAFTGEISPAMLRDIGCDFVILGHSERRHILHESDDMIQRKLIPALRAGLRPILCVGETLEQRRTRQTTTVISRQLRIALKGLAKADIEKCEIAYEPVWAIGTGMNAAPAQIDQVHRTIRRFLARQVGQTSAERLRILYGGSVKPENSREIAVLDEVNGLLVGGAGLKIETFWPVVEAFD